METPVDSTRGTVDRGSDIGVREGVKESSESKVWKMTSEGTKETRVLTYVDRAKTDYSRPIS